MSINVDGLDGLIARLDGLIDDNQTTKAIQKACLIVERSAKQKAHSIRDTGNLANSIKSKVEKDSGEVVGVVYTPLLYAPYVEYGTGLFAENGGRKDVPWVYKDDKGKFHTTSGQHPQPFMRPALNENREKILQILKEGVKND